ILARYTSGALAGRPAITQRRHAAGTATYVSTRLGPEGLRPVVAGLAETAGIESPLPVALRGVVERVVRGPYVFLINRTDAEVPLDDLDGELVAAPALSAALHLAPRGIAVLRSPGA